MTLTLARAEFKLRYLDSIVGYVWSLVQPLLLFLVLYFVWTELFNPGRDVPHYELALLLGIALFTFFSEATAHALTSLVSKGAMLRKIPFSPLALPVSSVLTSFYVYGLTLLIVIGFVLVSGIAPSLGWLEMVPVLLLLLVYTGGVALLLSMLYVTIRDVQQIWIVVLRLAVLPDAGLLSDRAGARQPPGDPDAEPAGGGHRPGAPRADRPLRPHRSRGRRGAGTGGSVPDHRGDSRRGATPLPHAGARGG